MNKTTYPLIHLRTVDEMPPEQPPALPHPVPHVWRLWRGALWAIVAILLFAVTSEFLLLWMTRR